MTKTMNKTLMITASIVALVAAGGVAFAQGANEPREKPAAATPAESGKSDRLKPDASHKTEAVKPEAAKPASNAQLPAKPTGAKSELKSESKSGTKSETSGQASGAGMQPAQHDATTPSDRKVQGQADVNHAAPLSTEQHAKIWETIRGEKAASFSGERFSVTVGEMVPQTVHLYRLPARVIEYAPQYRGYEYIQVGEDILIVDPRTHRIVAVIAA
jgi:hypothetical protein